MDELSRWATELLLNWLWQGCALALLAWCFLRLAPSANAATRYAVWFSALLALVSLPLLNSGAQLLSIHESEVAPMRQVAATAAWKAAQELPPPFVGPAPASRARFPIAAPAGMWASLLTALWAALAVVMIARLARS